MKKDCSFSTYLFCGNANKLGATTISELFLQESAKRKFVHVNCLSVFGIFSEHNFAICFLLFKNHDLKKKIKHTMYCTVATVHTLDHKCTIYGLNLILSTFEPRSGEVKKMLRANEPMASKVVVIDKHSSFTPALKIKNIKTVTNTNMVNTNMQKK